MYISKSANIIIIIPETDGTIVVKIKVNTTAATKLKVIDHG